MQNDPWAAPQAPQTNPMPSSTSPLAIASLAMGIASFPGILCCSCMAAPLPILGLILGIVAFRDAKRAGGGSNQTLAIGGMASNGLSLVIMLVFFVFAMVVHGVENMSDFTDNGVMETWEQPVEAPSAPEP